MLAFSVSVVGCARWANEDRQPTASTQLFPAMRKSLDSVIVETVLVRFPLSANQELDEIWQQTDESVLDISKRKRLYENGLRAGLIVGEIPKAIRDRIEETSYDQSTDALEHAGLAADVDNKMRQLHCRSGRRKELIVRRELPEPLTVISTQSGSVSGETFDQPTVLFELRAIPHGDQQATVELVPEIQHGEMKQSFVSSEFGMRPEFRRPRHAWRELNIPMKLAAGQVMLVAATVPPKCLGSAFFTTHTADQSVEHVLLMLRVAETQLDELFEENSISEADALAEH